MLQVVAVSGSSGVRGDSLCLAAGAQSGAHGDPGVSIPGQQTWLLLPPLWVQPVARLNVYHRQTHTHTNAEDTQTMLTQTVTQAAMQKALP